MNTFLENLSPQQISLITKISQPNYLTALFLVISLKFISLWSLPYSLFFSYLLALALRHGLLLPFVITPHFKDITFTNSDHHYYALISGATSGIGYGLCKKFAKDNFNLVLVGRRGERLEKAKNTFENNYGVKVIVIEKDMSVRGKVAESLDKEIKSQDPQAIVVHVVNNAGFGSNGDFVKLDVETELNMIDLNVCSLVDMSHYFANQMMKWKQEEAHKSITPRITNIASVASFLYGPRMTTYYATKHFVSTFSISFAQEMKKHGISVTVVCPGAIDTEFFDRAKVVGRFLKETARCPVDHFVNEAYPQMINGELYTMNGGMNQALVTIVSLIDFLALRWNLALNGYIAQLE